MLVALFDPVHIHHEVAHAWFERHRDEGWATCPLTENGLIRVLASPAYPGRRTPLADALARLGTFVQAESHQFWEDTVTLRNAQYVDPAHIGGAHQVTDVYLLALAVRNEGRLVTLDQRIRTAAVRGAASEQLVQLG